jgi:hypothetical protein
MLLKIVTIGTKTGRHDITEILLKVALNTNIEIHSKFAQIFPIVTIFSNIQIQVVFYSKVPPRYNIVESGVKHHKQSHY